MKLAAYMAANGLDEEAMAARVREAGAARCDRSTINRLKNGRQWLSSDLARALKVASGGAVTADDCLDAFVEAEQAAQ
jgi:hypothetical protein